MSLFLITLTTADSTKEMARKRWLAISEDTRNKQKHAPTQEGTHSAQRVVDYTLHDVEVRRQAIETMLKQIDIGPRRLVHKRMLSPHHDYRAANSSRTRPVQLPYDPPLQSAQELLIG